MAIIYKTVWSLIELTGVDMFNEKNEVILGSRKRWWQNAKLHSTLSMSMSIDWSYGHIVTILALRNIATRILRQCVVSSIRFICKAARWDDSTRVYMHWWNSWGPRWVTGYWNSIKGNGHDTSEASGNNTKSCLKLSAEHCCWVVENVLYTVVGSQDVTYSVRQNDAVPHEVPTCPLTSRECNTCVHSLSCTCLDSAFHNTICIHLHLVIWIYKPVCHYTTDHKSNVLVHQPGHCSP